MSSRHLIVLLALAAGPVAAQMPDPVATQAAQREALAVLKPMDGVWRGPAWTLLPNGEKRHLVQTERIGPFLGETLKVIEGRGYLPDGTVGFNALGVVSYDPAKKAYAMRSYALGHAGDFAFRPDPLGGYAWDIPAGPTMTIRYVATIRDGVLHEVGHRVPANGPPVQIFEMTLKRVGDTTWPAGDAVPRN